MMRTKIGSATEDASPMSPARELASSSHTLSWQRQQEPRVGHAAPLQKRGCSPRDFVRRSLLLLFASRLETTEKQGGTCMLERPLHREADATRIPQTQTLAASLWSCNESACHRKLSSRPSTRLTSFAQAAPEAPVTKRTPHHRARRQSYQCSVKVAVCLVPAAPQSS